MSNPGEKQMPNIKYADKAVNIGKAQLEFMKLIEQQNFERVHKLQRVRRNNLITGGALAVSVLGIYAYTILSVKQETFLDDFDEPKKVST